MTSRTSGISSKGAQTRLSTHPLCMLAVGHADRLYVHPTGSWHKVTCHDTHSGDTEAPERGLLGNLLRTKCSERQRQTLEAPGRPSPVPWSAHLEWDRTFQR